MIMRVLRVNRLLEERWERTTQRIGFKREIYHYPCTEDWRLELLMPFELNQSVKK